MRVTYECTLCYVIYVNVWHVCTAWQPWVIGSAGLFTENNFDPVRID